jgi:hypothetical protein
MNIVRPRALGYSSVSPLWVRQVSINIEIISLLTRISSDNHSANIMTKLYPPSCLLSLIIFMMSFSKAKTQLIYDSHQQTNLEYKVLKLEAELTTLRRELVKVTCKYN